MRGVTNVAKTTSQAGHPCDHNDSAVLNQWAAVPVVAATCADTRHGTANDASRPADLSPRSVVTDETGGSDEAVARATTESRLDAPLVSRSRKTWRTRSRASQGRNGLTAMRLRLLLLIFLLVIIGLVGLVNAVVFAATGFALNGLGTLAALGLLVVGGVRPGRYLRHAHITHFPRWSRAALRGALASLTTGLSLMIMASVLLVALQLVVIAPTLPQTSGTIQVAGLSRSVTVIRDQYGVPYIEAANRHDELFAQGYVTAQDQLFSMDLNRRAAEGTLAALLGAGPQDTLLDSDIFVRRLGIPAAAQAEWNVLQPGDQEYQDLSAYTQGINAYISGQRAHPPIEYTLLGAAPAAWMPADTLAVARYFSFTLENWYTKVAFSQVYASAGPAVATALFPPYPSDNPTVLTASGSAAPLFGAMTSSSPAGAIGHPGWRAQGLAAIATDPALVQGLRALFAGPSQPAQSLSAPSGGLILGMPGMPDLQAALTVAHALIAVPGLTSGSNSWVVDGSLTTSGHPLLANDPHLFETQPDALYQIALYGGGFRVVGMSIPGLPGVLIGHNASIAWGVTVLGSDDLDLYHEQVIYDAAGHPVAYRYDGTVKPLAFRTERIAVAGASTVTLQVPLTNNGPIVNGPVESSAPNSYLADWSGWQPIAIRWVGTEPGMDYDFLTRLDQATDWASFNAALDTVPFGLNVSYADAQGPVGGNIGYRMASVLPVRSPANGLIIVDGASSKYRWTGYVPQAELPRLYDPLTHAIITANNEIVPDDYPVYVSNVSDEGYRAARIEQLLEQHIAAGQLFTPQYFAQMQADVVALPAATLTSYFIAAGRAAGGQAAAAADLLASWSPRYAMTRESAAAAVYEVTMSTLYRQTLEGVLGVQVYPSVSAGDLYDGSGPATVLIGLLQHPSAPFFGARSDAEAAIARDQAIVLALDTAMQYLRQALGPDSTTWQWGALHQVSFVGALGQPSPNEPAIVNELLQHLFSLAPIARPGDEVTLNQGGDDMVYGDQPSFAVDYLSAARLIMDPSNWDVSRWMGTSGQSGQIGSSHWGDQAQAWNQQRYQDYQPMLFSPSALQALHSKAVLTLNT